jgi:hypothetical protein
MGTVAWVRWLQTIERRPGYLLLDLPTRSLPVRVEVVLRERAWKVRRKGRQIDLGWFGLLKIN